MVVFVSLKSRHPSFDRRESTLGRVSTRSRWRPFPRKRSWCQQKVYFNFQISDTTSVSNHILITKWTMNSNWHCWSFLKTRNFSVSHVVLYLWRGSWCFSGWWRQTVFTSSSASSTGTTSTAALSDVMRFFNDVTSTATLYAFSGQSDVRHAEKIKAKTRSECSHIRHCPWQMCTIQDDSFQSYLQLLHLLMRWCVFAYSNPGLSFIVSVSQPPKRRL